MAFFDFLKGKQSDDLGFGDLEKDLGADLGLPELGETSSMPSMPAMPGAPTAPPRPTQYSETGAGSPQAFQEPSLTPAPLERQVRELPTPGMPGTQERIDATTMYTVRKEIELLDTKLDAIRSALDSMNQRLINIERMAMYDQEKKRNAW